MNWLTLIIQAAPYVVHTIQSVIGDKAAGADKKTMAKDALVGAGSTAGAILTGSNAVYANAAQQIAGLVIDQTVAIAKANGTYAKATAIATAAQQDVQVAAAVDQLVKSVQTPQPPPASNPQP